VQNFNKFVKKKLIFSVADRRRHFHL